MVSCQSKRVNRTTRSFPNTACNFAEDTAILISTPLTGTSLDVSSNDLTGIALCSIDNEFSPSTDTTPESAHCADLADIKYPAAPRACAFSTNVIGLNANSSGPGALAQDQPVCWRRRTCPHRFAILSDYPASGATAPAIPMTENNNDNNNN
jgi:hypothetical protein